jgi:hypothetical protein
MIEIVIVEIKIPEISVHANNEAAGGEAYTIVYIDALYI